MKKFLTLRNIALFCGALLLLVAFFISFAASIKIIDGNDYTKFYNVIWGCNKMDTSGHITVLDADEKMGVAVLPFIGLWLLLVGALGAILVGLLVKKPFAKWVVVVCAVLALAGAIMQFFIFDQFVRAFIHKMAEDLHVTDKEQIKHAIEQYKEMYGAYKRNEVVSILMGVFGILGGLAIGASQFLPEKK